MAGEFHYPIGGSKIELYEQCPGAVKASEPYKGQRAGPAAQRGTRIHAYTELIWNQTFAGHKMTKEDKELIKTLDQVERQTGLAFVEALKLLCQKYGFKPEDVQIAQQFAFVPEIAGGTPDAFCFRAFGDLLMVDFKTGSMPVHAMENLQLLFYICTILRNLDSLTASTFESVHLVILQSDPEAPIINVDTWSISASQLAEYDGRFANIVRRAVEHPDLRIPGDHCVNMWCPARATCPERLAMLNEESLGVFDEALAGNFQHPHGERLAAFLKVVPAFVDWIDTVKNEAKELIKTTPKAVPGWYLGKHVVKHAWNNDKEVKAKAKELGIETKEIEEKKLISKTQMEKLLKIKGLDASWIAEMTHEIATDTLKQGEAPEG